VRIEIQDNGVGIPPEQVEKIFAPGFSTDEKSLGMGLHMAATTAMEMDGCLSARSAGPGLGATFVLSLPAERRAAVA